MESEQRPVYFIGIDPGTYGALAVVSGDGLAAEVHDFEGAVELHVLFDYLSGRMPDGAECRMVMIEKVGAMPKQGVSSTFKFGKVYGEIIGVVTANNFRLDYVAPGVWKRTFGLSKDKELSRRKATELFPQHRHNLARKKDHNRAEALLIAEYARRAGTA